MKIAVFSDIHGNLKALKVVLKQIAEKKVDKVVFLGDIFQRGNEELECLDFIRENKIMCVKVNCELYLQNGVDVDNVTNGTAKTSFTQVMSVTGGQRTFFTYAGASAGFGEQ